MKRKLIQLICMASALCCAALLADPEPIALPTPTPPERVTVTLALTPEQTEALLNAVAQALDESSRPMVAKVQSFSGHRAGPGEGASVDFVFNLTWESEADE